MDFTLSTNEVFLISLIDNDYMFVSVSDYLKSTNVSLKQIILRHDVDARPLNSLATARMEHELGIRGTYYFRMVPGSYDEAVIQEIAGLGHEIGYHYETLSQIGNRLSKTGYRLSVIGYRFDPMEEEEMLDMAYQMFAENLDKLSEIVPVETICMHGSPLSRYDNRQIWKKYDYRELGIIGEASLDIDFKKVAYYTDTGRRWDGADFNVRDKVYPRFGEGETKRLRDEGTKGLREEETERFRDLETKKLKIFPTYHSTFDMIKAIENGTFPNQAMITIHPQRWNDAVIPWTKELVWQNVKNVGKLFVIKMRENSKPPPPPAEGTPPR